jgi:peptide chain release factor 1
MNTEVMLERLERFETELADTERLLGDSDVLADRARVVPLTRRHRQLQPIAAAAVELRRALDDLAGAKELLAETSGAERESMRTEAASAEARVAELEALVRVLLLPPDPNAGRNVILEIRGAEGGEEANLFARDLSEMYRAWAAKLGWKVEVLSASPSDLGGYSDITLQISGPDTWTRLKFEAGPHRVQRVPVTESQGRVHTSSATVTVLPEAEEVEIQIDPNDLQIDVFRSSGPGGQSVNTTDSAVRITHKPTGVVVSMQDEKSQIQNRARALVVLRSRLLQAEQERQAAELSDARRGQVGGGGRSEKIRTYNFKENRVSDHRIGLTIHSLDRILAGDLTEISDALIADERTRQLAEEFR